jgi:hypothetical protein
MKLLLALALFNSTFSQFTYARGQLEAPRLLPKQIHTQPYKDTDEVRQKFQAKYDAQVVAEIYRKDDAKTNTLIVMSTIFPNPEQFKKIAEELDKNPQKAIRTVYDTIKFFGGAALDMAKIAEKLPPMKSIKPVLDAIKRVEKAIPDIDRTIVGTINYFPDHTLDLAKIHTEDAFAMAAYLTKLKQTSPSNYDVIQKRVKKEHGLDIDTFAMSHANDPVAKDVEEAKKVLDTIKGDLSKKVEKMSNGVRKLQSSGEDVKKSILLIKEFVEKNEARIIAENQIAEKNKHHVLERRDQSAKIFLLSHALKAAGDNETASNLVTYSDIAFKVSDILEDFDNHNNKFVFTADLISVASQLLPILTGAKKEDPVLGELREVMKSLGQIQKQLTRIENKIDLMYMVMVERFDEILNRLASANVRDSENADRIDSERENDFLVELNTRKSNINTNVSNYRIELENCGGSQLSSTSSVDDFSTKIDKCLDIFQKLIATKTLGESNPKEISPLVLAESINLPIVSGGTEKSPANKMFKLSVPNLLWEEKDSNVESNEDSTSVKKFPDVRWVGFSRLVSHYLENDPSSKMPVKMLASPSFLADIAEEFSIFDEAFWKWLHKTQDNSFSDAKNMRSEKNLERAQKVLKLRKMIHRHAKNIAIYHQASFGNPNATNALWDKLMENLLNFETDFYANLENIYNNGREQNQINQLIKKFNQDQIPMCGVEGYALDAPGDFARAVPRIYWIAQALDEGLVKSCFEVDFLNGGSRSGDASVFKYLAPDVGPNDRYEYERFTYRIYTYFLTKGGGSHYADKRAIHSQVPVLVKKSINDPKYRSFTLNKIADTWRGEAVYSKSDLAFFNEQNPSFPILMRSANPNTDSPRARYFRDSIDLMTAEGRNHEYGILNIGPNVRNEMWNTLTLWRQKGLEFDRALPANRFRSLPNSEDQISKSNKHFEEYQVIYKILESAVQLARLNNDTNASSCEGLIAVMSPQYVKYHALEHYSDLEFHSRDRLSDSLKDYKDLFIKACTFNQIPDNIAGYLPVGIKLK